jgi:hypothetical protein
MDRNIELPEVILKGALQGKNHLIKIIQRRTLRTEPLTKTSEKTPACSGVVSDVGAS